MRDNFTTLPWRKILCQEGEGRLWINMCHCSRSSGGKWTLYPLAVEQHWKSCFPSFVCWKLSCLRMIRALLSYLLERKTSVRARQSQRKLVYGSDSLWLIWHFTDAFYVTAAMNQIIRGTFCSLKAYLFLSFSKQGVGKCKAYQWDRGEGLKPDKPKLLEILLMLWRWKESPNKKEPQTYLAKPHSWRANWMQTGRSPCMPQKLFCLIK